MTLTNPVTSPLQGGPHFYTTQVDSSGNVNNATGNASQPAGAAGNVVVKATAGYLWSATVTATGTAGLSIYDNSSSASGTILLSIPASAPVGSIYAFPGGAPAINGIVSAGVLSCPGVTFYFS